MVPDRILIVIAKIRYVRCEHEGLNDMSVQRTPSESLPAEEAGLPTAQACRRWLCAGRRVVKARPGGG
jgi:hypothetical protein